MSTQSSPGSNASFSAYDPSSIDHYAKQQLMAQGEDSQRIRANASLPKQAWESIDDTVYPTMDSVLTIVSALREAGLTTPEDINNKTTEWQIQDDDHEATTSMQPETKTDEGNVDYDLDGAVLPIIQDDFTIGFRDSGSADDMYGGNLETLNAEAAARAVAEAMEYMVFNGWEATIGNQGYTSYGMTNHPAIHTGDLGDWEADPGAIRDDLRNMAGDIKDDKFFPGSNGYWSFWSRNLWDRMDDIDPDGSGDLLVRDRVEPLSDLGMMDVADFLPDDSVLMFRPTSDVIDLAFAADEQTVQWDGPFRDYFKVMSIMSPRVKVTKHDQCGIAYYTA